MTTAQTQSLQQGGEPYEFSRNMHRLDSAYSETVERKISNCVYNSVRPV